MAGAAWRDAWILWRNRLLADARFQRFAAEFPLTRPVAAGRTQALFDLVAGFVYSQTLSACVRLDLFNRLQASPRTLAFVSEVGDLPTAGAERLMNAACALRLVDRLSDGRYALGPHGAALLGASGLMDMIAHHDRLYLDLEDSLSLLRRGRGGLAEYWPYATSNAPAEAGSEGVRAYSALMASTQPSVSADLLRAYPVERHRTLLDVGGGDGVFLAAAGARAPNLRLVLFDLPAVAARARGRLAAEGLAGRAEVLEGDFHSDALPSGADLVSLVRILHDQDEDGALALLRKTRDALAPGGVLLIAEPMAASRGGSRVADVYFAFYLLAMGRGRARSPKDIADKLRASGFSRINRLRTRTPALLQAIAARA